MRQSVPEVAVKWRLSAARCQSGCSWWLCRASCTVTRCLHQWEGCWRTRSRPHRTEPGAITGSFCLKPGVGQNIALHANTAAGSPAFLICVFPTSCSLTPPPYSPRPVYLNIWSCAPPLLRPPNLFRYSVVCHRLCID